MQDKKVLTIQDYSSFGQCSISVALPIISAMGIETVAIPIALLSTHTSGFKGYTYVDLSGNLSPAAKHIKSQGLDFGYIYLGYLGKSSIALSCGEIARLFPNAKLIVDPAIAEDGKLYSSLDKDMIENMLDLCRKSYLALPNLSEACFMADEDYSRIKDKNDLLKLSEKLNSKGVERFVITGVRINDKMSLAYCDGISTHILDTQAVEGSFHGSGDVFASSLVGALANDLPLEKSIELAIEYTLQTIKLTSKDKAHWYGLKFEKTIPYLLQLLKKYKNHV